MKNMLDRIIMHKKREVENAKNNLPLSEIEAQARAAAAPRGFITSIKNAHDLGKAALIAEIKKASPSKGLIREDFDPASLAQAYEAGGATCISVLTDVAFFQGHPIYLKEVRTASTLPVLRKDFMIDTYQVVEARAWGADCILVIMAAVDDVTAQSLTNMAKKWGMDVLIEVHNRQELERALKLNSILIGINNRNLQTFDIKLETTEGLAPLIPKDRIVVSESGIFEHKDLVRLSHIGVDTYLVGECLMRQKNVERATKILLGKEVGAEEPEAENDKSADGAALAQAKNNSIVAQVDKTSVAAAVGLVATAVPKPNQSVAAAPEQGQKMAVVPQAVNDQNSNADRTEKPADGEAAADDDAKNTDIDFQAAVQELGEMIGGATGEVIKSVSLIDDNSAGNADAKSSNSELGHSQDNAKLSHVDESGAARMVDISDKSISQRVAVAEGFVQMQAETLGLIQQNAMKKGDVLAAARLAGIMAAKKTSDLIPLCHPLSISGVEVNFVPQSEPTSGIRVTAMVKVDGKTGVEMEALTAVSVACLTIYDMAKAIDKGMSFSGIRLLEKTGGKSGAYHASDAAE